MNSKPKTWDPETGNWNHETGNWNPHPLMHPPFIFIQCWCKCCYLKSLTSLGHHHTALMTSWVVTLSGDAEANDLITPFMKGEMVAPGACCDTLPQVPWYAPMSSQPGYVFLLKTCRKSIICTGMYEVSKTWVCTKLKHLLFSIYTTSSAF